ncbi:MAG: UDP-N-acetylmuramoyl-L-alanine--D-glutamate ligase [Elusimicrobiaceae bacterium]|nr:UDP-N-acetylmuramoyl-L-alanine--D-glutamate ligase [Elusimicrobiaceae bacterium]
MPFNPETVKGLKGCVIGYGKSGISCAQLLRDNGFEVLLTEARDWQPGNPDPAELGPGIKTEFGGHSDEVLECGFAVKSPGIPMNRPIIRKLLAANIPVLSEIEIALAFAPEIKIFAVTGTNGKTTTTTLLGDILNLAAKKSGRFRVHVAGNIGTPVSVLAREMREGDCLVIETSSYQLEDSSGFRPNAACILNITPDHLEHHGTMTGYIAAKKKIFREQTPQDCCVFNAADAVCLEISNECPSEVLYFARECMESVRLDAFYENGRIIFNLPSGRHEAEPPKLPGIHNIENAMAAGLMAINRGIPLDCVEEVFSSFQGVEHRIETVAVVNGIKCINDSKATNVDSTKVALESLVSEEKNIWLIMGGTDKGNPYAPLEPLIRQSVRKILTIGQAADRIEHELNLSAEVENCETMENAIEFAFENAKEGDILLLSPACASFDQFTNFEERGEHFKKLIQARL